MHFKIDLWILKENNTELFDLRDLLKQSHKSTFALPKTLFMMTTVTFTVTSVSVSFSSVPDTHRGHGVDFMYETQQIRLIPCYSMEGELQ